MTVTFNLRRVHLFQLSDILFILYLYGLWRSDTHLR